MILVYEPKSPDLEIFHGDALGMLHVHGIPRLTPYILDCFGTTLEELYKVFQTRIPGRKSKL